MRNIKKITAAVVTAFLIFCISGYAAQTQGKPVVTIAQTIGGEINKAVFDVGIQIKFPDNALYNEQVKASFHIYDEKGNKLRYENERLPLIFDGTNYNAAFYFDFRKDRELSGKKAVIKFDIIDEKNVFWFSEITGLTLTDAEIKVQIPEVSLPRATIFSLDLSKLHHSAAFGGRMEVDFSDNELLYNDKVKLSYHIIVNGEQLPQENPRTPLKPNPDIRSATGKESYCADLDLNFRKEDFAGKPFKLVFDLIDEKKGFWFSKNADIEFEPYEVDVEPTHIGEFLHNAKVIVKTQLPQIIIVAVSFIAFFMILSKVKKVLNPESDAVKTETKTGNDKETD